MLINTNLNGFYIPLNKDKMQTIFDRVYLVWNDVCKGIIKKLELKDDFNGNLLEFNNILDIYFNPDKELEIMASFNGTICEYKYIFKIKYVKELNIESFNLNYDLINCERMKY